MTPEIAHRQNIERIIVSTIVNEAISKGYSVSVDYNDGAFDKPVERSTDATEILKHTMATDEENLIFHRKDGTYAGFVFLVYGNDGYDAINDHSATIEIEDILWSAIRYAETAESADDPDEWNNVGSRLHY